MTTTTTKPAPKPAPKVFDPKRAAERDARIAELETELAALKAEQIANPVPYPAARYHATLGSKTITGPEEEADGWTADPPPPDPHIYPSYRYHTTYAPRLVGSAEEAADLGPGWSTTPVAHAAPPAVRITPVP